uniref:Uncharacterized protein n=1 Tax=viral metagenome TaxID=1070528 RepID=A0A6C0CJY3_9ZZZZ
MNTDDPVADVPPEQTADTSQKPTVSSASGYLGYTLLLILLLVYSRAGWYAVETIVFGKFPIMKPYAHLFLVVWFIPILGLLASLVVPSVGGMFAWAIATAVIAGIPMVGAFIYIVLFGLPPETYEYVAGLFTTKTGVTV